MLTKYLEIYLTANQKIRTICLVTGVLIALLFLVVVPILSVQAQQAELEKTAGAAGIKGETDLAIIVGKIVGTLLGFLGLIAVVIVIIGGFQWMTSGGNEDKIKSARSLMVNGLIGLVIIVLAYALASFVIARIQDIAASNNGGGGHP